MINDAKNRLSHSSVEEALSYTLSRAADFSEQAYALMTSDRTPYLCHCLKNNRGDCVDLIYLTKGMSTLSEVIRGRKMSDIDLIDGILHDIALSLTALSRHGGFDASNLELELNRIYVDAFSHSVRFVYFPMVASSPEGRSDFVSAYKSIVRAMGEEIGGIFGKVVTLYADNLELDALSAAASTSERSRGIADTARVYLSVHGDEDGQSGLPEEDPITPSADSREQTHEDSRGADPAPHSADRVKEGMRIYHGYQLLSDIPQPLMCVTSLEYPEHIILTVDKPEYTIGKSEGTVDGAVTYNPAISRVHCKISYSYGRYYLTDLGSLNGTFVNSIKLFKRQTVELHDGDYLKLADSDFVITFDPDRRTPVFG